jgi:hypothetical protein
MDNNIDFINTLNGKFKRVTWLELIESSVIMKGQIKFEWSIYNKDWSLVTMWELM